MSGNERTDTAELNEKLISLYRCLNDDDTLNSLMDRLFGYLRFPLLYLDDTSRIVASRLEGRAENPILRRMVETGTHDLASMDRTFFERVMELTRSPGPVIAEEEGGRIITYSVLARRNLVGYITVFEGSGRLKEEDFVLLKTAAEIMSVKAGDMSAPLDAEKALYRKLIVSLISGNINVREELDQHMKIRNLDIRGSRHVLVTDVSGKTEAFRNHIMASLELITGNDYVSYEDNLVCLIPEGFLENKYLLDELRNYLRHTGLYIGISQPFEDLLLLGRYYDQTCYSILAGRQMQPDNHVILYEKYQYEYFIRECCDHMDVQQYIHPIISMLMKFDRENHTELQKTLKTYLNSNCNVKATGEKLFIHKNTVSYRLRQISELFGLDLGNMNDLLHIRISYDLLDCDYSH